MAETSVSDTAVYIHWPYCVRICPYCDFNVYKHRGETDLADFIIQDLTHQRHLTGERTVTSVHFGGGTPSLMTAEEITRIIGAVRELWSLAPTAEIALEANPNRAARELWEAYRDAGINRLSLGVQSFDEAVLAFLGRDHSGTDALKALQTATDIFDNVSADLIFGHFGQTETHWREDLNTALSTGLQHISTYQLTIEEGTAFERSERRGDIKAVDADASGILYDLTRETLMATGFEHYEISNFARPGFRSRHNLTYWTGRDYIGAGPGAHGRLTTEGRRMATETHLRPNAYKDSLTQAGHAFADTTTLTSLEQGEEYVMMGLRIADGISLSHFQALTGKTLPTDVMAEFCEQGLLEHKGDRLFATADGRPVLNTLIDALLI